jgi:FKBP-type peptidyl-prolyl cis-trans isomerase
MKSGLTLILIGSLGAALQGVAAEEKPATPPTPPPAPSAPPAVVATNTPAVRPATPPAPTGVPSTMVRPVRPPMAPGTSAPPAALPLPPGFKDQKEHFSYALGMYWGRVIKQTKIDLDLEVLTAAMRDMEAGKPMKLTEAQDREALQAFGRLAQAKAEEERVRLAEQNHKLGEAFLQENKKKEGIKTLPVTLPDGKTAEMQYKIITEGTGAIPKSNDVVSVNFRGTTLAGKEFDNTAKIGSPRRFPVGRRPALPGWSAAWEHMKAGSKWELYLPAVLTGSADRALIPETEPGATLIYEMELVTVERPAHQRRSRADAHQ